MVDILERLQSPQTSLGILWPQPNLHEEAAEKIIQLRKELDETKRAADAFVENEHLRKENARLIRENKVAFEAVGGVVKANDKLKEENTQLREALEPFADAAEYCEGLGDLDHKSVLVGTFRAATAVIREERMSDYTLKVPYHIAMPSSHAARWWGRPRFRNVLHYKCVHTSSDNYGTGFGSLYLPACLLPWNTPNVRRKG